MRGQTFHQEPDTWFTEETGNAVGRVTPGAVITEFTAGFPTGSPRGIVTGPDGNLWVAEAGGDGAIARVTKAGVVTEFPVPTPGDPTDIAAGPDGNLWYVDPGANLIGRITSDGSITEFTDGLTPAAQPTSIAKGPDGKLWFTERATGRIGRISTAGVITEFTSGLSGSGEPASIAKGPDGNLWFTLNADPGGIGRITPAGDVIEFSDGLTMNSRPLGITAGPDGALWFTESAAPGRIGRITTEGHITEYSSGLVAISNPWFIAAGPDGNMWFTGNNLPGRVARITLPPLVRELVADQIGTGSARLRGKVRPNSQATNYYFEYGPTEAYGTTTPTAYAGSSYDLGQVLATVDGLSPNAKYNYRVVAENDAGTTIGPNRVFATTALPMVEPEPEPEAQPAKPEPEFAKTIVAEGEGVRYKAGEASSAARGRPGAAAPAAHGAVVVRDFRRHRRVLVRAGHSYLAKARARRR